MTKKNFNESIYLQKLEFDESLNHSWGSFFIDRMRFTFLTIFLIAVAGYLGLKSLPLESTPEVSIGIAVVSTTLPGASPESMEDLVTKKLEKQIAKVKGIDTITSSSMNSVSMITVQFKSTVEIETAVRDLKDKVDLAQKDLPDDANDSVVQEISLDDTPIWTFSISGKYDGFALYDYAKTIKEELEKNPLISEVNISGGEEKEFGVFVDPKQLSEYGLSMDSINTAIKSANFTIPIGQIDVGNYNHSINVDSRFYDIEKLKNVVVAKLGDTGVIFLKDLAEVKETPKKVTSLSRTSIRSAESLPSVALGVVKKRGGSIVNLITQGTATLEDMRQRGIIPSEKELSVKTLIDQSERIKLDLSHLIRDGIFTVSLVFITLFLIIGVKEALVAGAAVPLVFLITFAVMAVKGQTLNFLSMFALILSLGLLVDDAIVVISAINQYKRSGRFTTREAALMVIRDYKKVLLTTTFTVVYIFSSMLFMTGIIGKYIFSIPFVITVTLLASLVVALTINPALAVIFSGKDSKHDPNESQVEHGRKGLVKRGLNNGFFSLSKLETFYGKILTYLLYSKKRVRVFLIGILLLFCSAVALPATGILKKDFFPKGDSDNIFINIEVEPGTKLDTTDTITKKVENNLLKEKEIDGFSVSVGALAQTGKGGGDGGSSENYSSITINLVKEEYGRKESSIDIAQRIRNEVADIKEAKITVIEEAGGPPTGSDFELQIAGDDFIILDKIALDVKNILATVPGAINIETSRKPLPFEFNVILDSEKLYLYDITAPQVATFLKNVIDGTEASKIYKGTDEIVIRTRFRDDRVNNFDKIKEMTIKNNKGVEVSLRDLVKQNFKASVFSIKRIDQERVVSVTASVDKTTTSTQLKENFDKKMGMETKSLITYFVQIKSKFMNYTFGTKIPETNAYQLPSGYKFITGGANEENAKSITSLMVSMVFGMMFVVGTLVLLYDSYKQAVLVMVTIPLSLIGVFYGLTFFLQPLSFPGMIGLVALFGIVVRNGIILFDKINQNLGENIPFKEAIIDAGMSRLEPVVLTSICTVLGMVPLTLSNPTWTSLGLSIIFGLTTSTLFTLLTLPSLYYNVFYKKYNPKQKFNNPALYIDEKN